ncbi:MAG: putative aminohydrolase SsnA [Anaerolineae bacterium]|nr:MAG: putative aminohydrolase SsnA [Anaerolineae bacterium]
MLITNATLITWEQPNRILENHALYIEGGLIRDLGPDAELTARYPDEERLDARGQYVMPGNIVAHTHFYGAFARGMGIPGAPPKDFPEILQKLWWPLDKALTEEAVRYSALVSLIDAVKHGATTLIDHHASPNAIAGSLDILAETVEEAGLRAVLCYEVTDRDGEEKAQEGIRENVRFIKKTIDGGQWTADNHGQRSPAHGLVRASFGLHASLTLSDATLDACREAAEGLDTGFHIHAAESVEDQWDSLQKSGLRVIDRLHKHGILGPKTITAHAVHVDAREIELLAETGTWVTHQPRSNMNNAVGAAPVESMLRAGVRVCLGNDGFANAMWEEWKTAYLLQKVWHRDPRRMNGYDVVQMAIYNNAALAGVFFPEAPIGVIKAGAVADLIFVDYHPFTPLTPENLPWHILFGFHESMVTTTIVAGKVLMKDRQLLTLDEAEIAARARELAPQVWERYSSLVR